jgi:DNA-binding response OmpR family regulator/Tfp pilus assembly protein PilF
VNLLGDTKHMRALVIDGDTISRSILVAQLRDMGFGEVHQLRRVQDGRQKLELNTYDLVVCEYHFERSPYTGRDLLDDLRQHALLPLSTTFVMVTNERHYSKVAEVAETALDGYLLKPYKGNNLLERIAVARFRKRELQPIFDAIETNQMEKASDLCMRHFDAKGRHWLYTARIGAEISLNLGKVEDAQRLYNVVTQEKALPWARLGIAKVQGVQGQLQEARNTLDHLIADHRSFVDAYDVMAHIQMSQGQLEEAYATYEMACKITPAALTRIQKAGMLAQYTGRQKEAERYMAQAIEIGAGSRMFDPITSVVYAFCKYAQDDERSVAQCADTLSEALAASPESPRLQRFVLTLQTLLKAKAGETAAVESLVAMLLADALSSNGDMEAATNLVTLLGLVAERVPHKEKIDQTLLRLVQRFASSRMTLDVLVGSSSQEGHKQVIQQNYQAIHTRVQAAIALTLENRHEDAVRDLIRGAHDTGNQRFIETAEGALKRHAARIGPAAQEMGADIEALKAKLSPPPVKPASNDALVAEPTTSVT